MASDAQRAIEAVWRLESPKIVAALTRMVRDLTLAEDLAQDALVAALEQWPTEGTPIFNEGYSATTGDDWVRPALCEDALRLGRVLAELVPGEAEVHGLVALMELQASRLRARVGPGGEAVRLTDQNHARAPTLSETDWRCIAALYAELVAVTNSPVVRLNHAVAVAMADGPEAGLTLVDSLMSDGTLGSYH